MGKSKKSFVLGLIGSLLFGIIGFLFWLVSTIFIALFSLGTADVPVSLTLVAWLCIAGALIGIIGSSFCFKRAKIGAIILTVSTVLCSSLFFFLLISAIISKSNISDMLAIFVILIPMIFDILATVFAYKAKEEKINNFIISQDNINEIAKEMEQK